jgi:hypothetical protein
MAAVLPQELELKLGPDPFGDHRLAQGLASAITGGTTAPSLVSWPTPGRRSCRRLGAD